jgi:hypothetical protein
MSGSELGLEGWDLSVQPRVETSHNERFRSEKTILQQSYLQMYWIWRHANGGGQHVKLSHASKSILSSSRPRSR